MEIQKQMLKDAILRLHNHVVKQEFKGYSLYDSHNSFMPFGKFGNTISFLVNQTVKRSPVNLRPLLGVKKGVNPKGAGLFLHTYSLMHDTGILPVEDTENIMRDRFEWLRDNPSKDYSGHCWGYNYDWPKRNGKMVAAYTPSVVVTGFICRALMAYWKVTQNPEVKGIIKSACEFVKNDVACTVNEQGRCYSYTPIQRDLVVNASLLAAEILGYDDYLSGEKKYAKEVNEVIDYTLNVQNEDGSWYYSFDINENKPKDQIDFHQGYVLDSLDILKSLYDLKDPKIEVSIKKGIDFYYTKQYNEEGFMYWRLPKRWPIDIHNQSQGVISFCRFQRINRDFISSAENIIDWTWKNMRAPSGRYYYQKYPFFTSRTNYLRWNQGWMFLALMTYWNLKHS